MRAVIGVFSRAEQAREALDEFAMFGAVREQIRLLTHHDDAGAIDRAISEYNIRVNNSENKGERALLVLNVLSTTDADRARDIMVAHGALTVAVRSTLWPEAPVLQLD